MVTSSLSRNDGVANSGVSLRICGLYMKHLNDDVTYFSRISNKCSLRQFLFATAGGGMQFIVRHRLPTPPGCSSRTCPPLPPPTDLPAVDAFNLPFVVVSWLWSWWALPVGLCHSGCHTRTPAGTSSCVAGLWWTDRHDRLYKVYIAGVTAMCRMLNVP